MDKYNFDSSLRRQVLSLPALLLDQYENLRPKCRQVLSTPEIFGIQRIIITGCGDSYAAALAMGEVFEKFCKIRTEVVSAIDLARSYDSRNLGFAPGNPLVIAISNSGAVARMGELAERCKKHGATVLAITGNPDSVLGKNSSKILQLDIPKFESAPGTRSYMVSLLALYLLAVRIGEVRGRYTMDIAQAYRKAIPLQAEKLSDLLEEMDDNAFKIAHSWKDFPALDFIGSCRDYSTAWFGHAKIYEATGQFSSHINSEEWLHLNFFMRDTSHIGTVIVATSENPALSRTKETITYAKELGRPLVVLTDLPAEEFESGINIIPIPTAVYPESLPITAFAPICLIAGYLQAIKGERSGRGCEGAWSFSKGAACVRQSKIEIVD